MIYNKYLFGLLIITVVQTEIFPEFLGETLRGNYIVINRFSIELKDYAFIE
jgi:hypothetical protein